MEYFTSISIKDIVDILIVSYVIYKLILLVRGTRAIQLMKGILVVVITWVISIWFKLSTLQWMMNQAFTFGVLAVIIIFQPELRRALEQLGRGKLFSRSSSEDDEDINKRIGDIIKAVNYLAKRKIGALIVFEKETGLTDYVESGTAIESKISSELLINIFIPNTPLHDGAVIIRQNILMAAGCYLPLSENPFISKELGTRHRAAIGMSEVSDAMCIIVSEETGQISLTMNGHILRDMKEESLIFKLFEELKPKTKIKEKNPFLRWRGRSNG
ncbi:diadenylate cyclase CdaA [Paenibacillus eucommiae]|uniref:Diadenylate cyclase n=1 Tax=Paenibacillus eucommiae TaxID=1355755 RepID=A0ABS4JC88_9BACL|nr:diadenylate cyclase CdaA [Paenibacillus eucommiae]MBP1996820.1 diadenylate cyclase [Paenibacillus eucommiae]